MEGLLGCRAWSLLYSYSQARSTGKLQGAVILKLMIGYLALLLFRQL